MKTYEVLYINEQQMLVRDTGKDLFGVFQRIDHRIGKWIRKSSIEYWEKQERGLGNDAVREIEGDENIFSGISVTRAMYPQA